MYHCLQLARTRADPRGPADSRGQANSSGARHIASGDGQVCCSAGNDEFAFISAGLSAVFPIQFWLRSIYVCVCSIQNFLKSVFYLQDFCAVLDRSFGFSETLVVIVPSLLACRGVRIRQIPTHGICNPGIEIRDIHTCAGVFILRCVRG